MINEFIDSIEISPEERAYYQSQFSDPRYFTRELFLRLGGQTVISTKRLKFTMQYALSILQVSKSISIVRQLRAQKCPDSVAHPRINQNRGRIVVLFHRYVT